MYRKVSSKNDSNSPGRSAIAGRFSVQPNRAKTQLLQATTGRLNIGTSKVRLNEDIYEITGATDKLKDPLTPLGDITKEDPPRRRGVGGPCNSTTKIVRFVTSQGENFVG